MNVGVLVGVGDLVLVGVLVTVGVFVGVSVRVGVGVLLAVLVREAVGLGVAVRSSEKCSCASVRIWRGIALAGKASSSCQESAASCGFFRSSKFNARQ